MTKELWGVIVGGVLVGVLGLLRDWLVSRKESGQRGIERRADRAIKAHEELLDFLARCMIEADGSVGGYGMSAEMVHIKTSRCRAFLAEDTVLKLEQFMGTIMLPSPPGDARARALEITLANVMWACARDLLRLCQDPARAKDIPCYGKAQVEFGVPEQKGGNK